MNAIQLAGIDLNLLVVLAVLLDEGSVTKAAERLGRTQSAVSHALERLRGLLGDPLFVRTGQQMTPTPRAESLREPVRDVAGRLVELLVEAPPFEPTSCDRSFTISASDYLQAVLVPPLVRGLRAAAPTATLLVHGPKGRLEERLGRGEMDFSLAVQIDDSAQLYSQPLFSDRFVCLIAADHPAARSGLDRAAYLRYPHALIAPLGRIGGHVDRALAKTGEKRRIAVLLPDFMIAPRTLPGTDLVLTLPERVARLFPEDTLRMVEPPIELPSLEAHLVWHERVSRDAAGQWFRKLVEATARGLDERGEARKKPRKTA